MKRQKIFRVLTFLITIALLISVFTACGNQSNEDNISKEEVNSQNSDQDNRLQEDGEVTNSYPIKYEDMRERKVEIEESPEKIVSLLPSTTEILFALGLGDRVVGVTQFCNYPEEAQSKEQVGDAYDLNIEKIVSLESDLVLAGTGIKEDMIEKLEDAGIPVVVIEGIDFEGVYKSIIDIGKITGKEDEASELVQDMKDSVASIEDRVKDAEEKDCYFVMDYGEGGNWTAGPGSFMDELINMAGGSNVASDGDSPWLEYSMEMLIEKDPEILIIPSDIDDVEKLKNSEGYKELTAVKDENVQIVNGDIISRGGPRLVDGLEEIAKAIHPELFE